MIQNPAAPDQALATAQGGGRGTVWLFKIRSQFGLVLATGVLLAAGYLLGMGKTWGDLAVACLLAGATQNLRRGFFVMASLGLFFLRRFLFLPCRSAMSRVARRSFTCGDTSPSSGRGDGSRPG